MASKDAKSYAVISKILKANIGYFVCMLLINFLRIEELNLENNRLGDVGGKILLQGLIKS